MLLGRYLPDGRLDPAFGTGGLVDHRCRGRGIHPVPCCSSRTVHWWWQGHSPSPLDEQRECYFAGALSGARLSNRRSGPCLAQLEAFVTDVYLAALARMPDASEVAYWVDVLATEPTPTPCGGCCMWSSTDRNFASGPSIPGNMWRPSIRPCWGGTPTSGIGLVGAGGPGSLQHAAACVFESSEFQRLVPSCQDQAAVTLLVGGLYQQVLRRVASARSWRGGRRTSSPGVPSRTPWRSSSTAWST